MSEFQPNKEQEKCIKTIDGRFLVLAGPGTGKTTTVVQRIKYMLEQGKNPEKILCLTFSDAAASEMKTKLNKAMNNIDTPINIYTFHSFCNEIINENTELFELSEDYKLINDTISKQFLKECIDEYNPIGYKNEKNDPYVYLKIIKEKIEEIKRLRLTKEQYIENLNINPNWYPYKKQLEEELIELKSKNADCKKIEKKLSEIENIDSKILKAKEIWEFFEIYKSKMQKENYIDFNDMIGFVLDKFEKSPAFLDSIANKYDYIMVDEYQDTNESQNEIVFNLVKASKSQNIFVVGDDDQIIYSFQGANLDTIGNFLKEFPNTNVICLKDNMRSTQSILNVARSISKQDARRLEVNPEFEKYKINKDLIAKNEKIIALDKKVRLRKFQNKEQEFINIVDEIEELVNSKDCPQKLSEIAILSSHADLAIFADLLKDRNIPFETKYGKSIFQIKSSLTLIYYLKAIVNPQLYSDKLLQVLMLEPFNIHPIDYTKIQEKISNNKTIFESIKENDVWVEKEKINSFIKTYDELKNYIANENVRNIVMEIGSKTGILNYFINEEINKNENILALKKIIDEANDFSKTRKDITITDFVNYLTMVQQDKDLDILIDKPDVVQDAIQLTTYHSSKGKEYDYVYMPTLQSSSWNASRKSFKPTVPVAPNKDKTDEEWKDYKISDAIKTMYVGMTRARHALRLSYLAQNGRKVTPVCPWITEASSLMEFENFEETSFESFVKQSKKSLNKKTYDYKRDFKDLIDKIIEDKYYSHSAISTYRQCPRQYLYEHILNFKSRAEISDAANYGNAIHKTCEYLINNAIKNKTYISKKEFILKFKEIIEKYPFSDFQTKILYEERGLNELDKFYQKLIETNIDSLFAVEYELKGEIDGIKIKGFIDKIIKNHDGTITIYDYKTSSALDLTQVCPNGKKEEYYIQVCLYKYFIEKLTDFKVKEAYLSFPIDSTSLNIPLEDEEIIRVFEDFKELISKIKTHDFEPKHDKIKCGYCPYKDFCSLEII